MLEAIIGLDVGTTVAKAVLFDASGLEPSGQGSAGTELEIAAQAYPLRTPRPGWAELEPEDIWQATLQVLRAVAGKAPPGIRVRAISLATSGGVKYSPADWP